MHSSFPCVIVAVKTSVELWRKTKRRGLSFEIFIGVTILYSDLPIFAAQKIVVGSGESPIKINAGG